jgi:hypothetical protein
MEGGLCPPNPGCPELDGKELTLTAISIFFWTSGIHTTPDPCECRQIYKGNSAFSEPESRSVQRLLDQNPHIDSMVDVSFLMLKSIISMANRRKSSNRH